MQLVLLKMPGHFLCTCQECDEGEDYGVLAKHLRQRWRPLKRLRGGLPDAPRCCLHKLHKSFSLPELELRSWLLR